MSNLTYIITLKIRPVNTVSTDSEGDIVRRHVQFCKKFKIPVNDLSLPFMHMLPKFHKPSLDFRYIAAGV